MSIDEYEQATLEMVQPEPEPKQTREGRMVPLHNWLAARGQKRVTIDQVQEHFGWDRRAVAQTLGRLNTQGVLTRVQPGVYTLAELRRAKKKSEPVAPEPKPEQGTIDYGIVDAVLNELFPNGVPVANLDEVIAWRKATHALLEISKVDR